MSSNPDVWHHWRSREWSALQNCVWNHFLRFSLVSGRRHILCKFSPNLDAEHTSVPAPGHAVLSSLETFIATCKTVTHEFITGLWAPVRVGIPCGTLTHCSSQSSAQSGSQDLPETGHTKPYEPFLFLVKHLPICWYTLCTEEQIQQQHPVWFWSSFHNHIRPKK